MARFKSNPISRSIFLPICFESLSRYSKITAPVTRDENEYEILKPAFQLLLYQISVKSVVFFVANFWLEL